MKHILVKNKSLMGYQFGLDKDSLSLVINRLSSLLQEHKVDIYYRDI